jgi:Fe(3+) dicitrate transport protein
MHIKRSVLAFLFPSILTAELLAQQPDSLRMIDLKEVEVHAPARPSVERLPSIQGTIINAGRRNDVVNVQALNADLSTNNPRQVFGRVPGIMIWESDGSGIQTSIATRGLSPNRSWEFNVRQNGYDICAEAFGYPEAYFSPPMEAVERIEIVRGAASLQYGPQFGGLLNYVLRKGPADKEIAFETRQTVGSYGLYNTYNSVGGTKGKWNYHAYLHHRNADGWRQNSRYDVNTMHASVNFAASMRTSIGLEYTHMTYASQQPGGLSDDRFREDPRGSLRARNWFSAPWNVAALTIDHVVNDDLRFNARIFGTHAQRNSVGFMQPMNVADDFDPELGSFSPRQMDRDRYSNVGAEIRMLKAWSLLGRRHHLSAGVRSYRGVTGRRQQGVGSAGGDLDLTPSGAYGRDLTLATLDHAVFAENMFQLGNRLSIIPGIRYELIHSTAQGRMNASGAAIEASQERRLLLYGVGAEFKMPGTTQLYASHSLSYRPVLYSDLLPTGTTDVIDPALRDASGAVVEAGWRGSIKDHITFDAGVFHMTYNDRIGTIQVNGMPFRTNIGTSVSKGVESYVEWDALRLIGSIPRTSSIKVFLSYAYTDARYTRWDDPARVEDAERTLVGKRVEYAPEFIARYGVSWSCRRASLTLQASDVAMVYTDAMNTKEPNAAGTIGELPGYQVVDVSGELRINKMLTLRAGVNNLLDAHYATRRSGGYPGPGLLPANGRTGWVSIGASF